MKIKNGIIAINPNVTIIGIPTRRSTTLNPIKKININDIMAGIIHLLIHVMNVLKYSIIKANFNKNLYILSMFNIPITIRINIIENIGTTTAAVISVWLIGFLIYNIVI
jgi:hypothetical protein|uniref:Uncharacterized protein n=1 Tax=viral metagenome TaxID=1070528 RepID=A0A6C0ETK9_9ZZZZ